METASDESALLDSKALCKSANFTLLMFSNVHRTLSNNILLQSYYPLPYDSTPGRVVAIGSITLCCVILLQTRW